MELKPSHHYSHSLKLALLLSKDLPDRCHGQRINCWLNHNTMDVHVKCGVGIELTDPRTGFPSPKLITQLLLVLL